MKKILTYFGIGTLFIVAILLYSFQKYPVSESTILPKVNKQIQPIQNPLCQKDPDCVVGILPSECCSCPEAISKNDVGNGGWEEFIEANNYSGQKPEKCNLVDCSPCKYSVSPACIEGICVNDEFSQGWYWGSLDQKKVGTPKDWVFSENGRSSCWHEVNTDCDVF